MNRILIFMLVFLLSANFYGQSIPLSEDAEVSILTCGNGNEVYSLFGHTAIRVKDSLQGIDIVYNYGAFDFATDNFILKFTKGNLQYFVSTSTFIDFMYQYQYERRSVWEQVLAIPQEKKQQLFDELNHVISSEERFYTYKFIDRNCTNMAVAIVNKTLGENLIYKRKNTDVTYRQTLYPYFNGYFYEQLGTSIIFGTKVDQQATFLFLPVEFQESLAETTYNGQPLAKENTILLDFGTATPTNSWWNNSYTLLLILGLVVLVNKKILTLTYLTIVALIGLFFSIAGFYSLHAELAFNYNVLLFNPIFFVLMYFIAIKNTQWIYKTAVLLAVCTVIYVVVIIGKVYFLIVTPIVVTHLIILGRMIYQNRKASLLAAIK